MFGFLCFWTQLRLLKNDKMNVKQTKDFMVGDTNEVITKLFVLFLFSRKVKHFLKPLNLVINLLIKDKQIKF